MKIVLLCLLFLSLGFITSCATVLESSLKHFSSDSTKGHSLGLILGPGGPKSFAHAGFLKALDKNEIPIKAIVGMEWGSVAGAFYAENKKVHSMDWRFYKLDSQYLGSRFWNQKAKDSSYLKKYFQKNFDGKELSSFKIPFSCVQFDVFNGNSFTPTYGNVAKHLEACVTYPPFVKTSRAFVAEVLSMKNAIEYLKGQGAEQIVFVDVIGAHNLFTPRESRNHLASSILWKKVQKQIALKKDNFDHYIYIDTNFMSFFDWTQRKKLNQRGKEVGEQFVKSLKEKGFF